MADMHCDFHRVCCNENINMADPNTSLDHLKVNILVVCS